MANHFEVPLSRSKTGKLIATVVINDTPIRLVVDTGATKTSLDRERAKRLSLDWKRMEGGYFTGPSVAPVEAVFSQPFSFSVGAYKRSGITLYGVDFSPLMKAAAALGDEPYDGVLGDDVLQPAEAVIDYGRQKLYLKSSGEKNR